MAEYYAVLKKAVSGMEGGAADARRTVYDKARNALIGQLKAIDPPLSTSEISRQRLELEEAIRRVEREAAADTQSVRGRAAASVREAITDNNNGGGSPQDVFRRAIQEAETRASQPVERAPIPARADTGYGDGRSMRDRIERAPQPPMPDPYQEPPQGRRPQPQLAPDYDYDWQPPPQQRGPAPEPMQAEPYVDRRDRGQPLRQAAPRKERGRGGRDDDQREPSGRGARRSRLPAILITVLVLLVIVGAGAFAWSQKDRILGIVADADKAATAQKEPDATPPATVATAPESSKDADRLGSADNSPTAPAPAVRQAEPSADTPKVTQLPQEEPAAAQGEGVVGQKATLYEEPLGGGTGGVTALTATATWQVVNGNDGPEVVATVNVPDRAMKLKITFRKNSDSALPASHLIETVINVSPSFPGKGIRSVPRLVMKSAEDARGEALVGAAAKVADGLFWIALSSAEGDVANNLKILRENSWMDVPMVYDNGQRAILTFEKGNPGDQAFQTAMAAWGG
jgi:hypothetical protein